MEQMQRITIITALVYEARKSLMLLEALADALPVDLARTQTDPLNGVILRRRRGVAVLRSLLRAEGAERTQPPIFRPARVDAPAVLAAETQYLANLDRQLARPNLPDDLRNLVVELREDVLQATLILSRLRDRAAEL